MLAVAQLIQKFGGRELYPSIEEKVAMLLYLVTKNHSFSDSNKRIAAFLSHPEKFSELVKLALSNGYAHGVRGYCGIA
jgi:hypothetical protein